LSSHEATGQAGLYVLHPGLLWDRFPAFSVWVGRCSFVISSGFDLRRWLWPLANYLGEFLQLSAWGNEEAWRCWVILVITAVNVARHSAEAAELA